jgi:outer membrane protein insertion porin family
MGVSPGDKTTACNPGIQYTAVQIEGFTRRRGLSVSTHSCGSGIGCSGFFKSSYRPAVAFLFAILCSGAHAQATTQSQAQAPKTSPQTQQILASYEGQNVSAMEIAGRPDLSTSDFLPLFVQRTGQPFSREKVDATIAALKRTGKFQEVQLEVAPEANGVRVLLVLQPAVYFGIFEFPGAGRFSYSRLVQVTNYPPEAAYNADDIQQAQQNLVTFFQREGFFQVQVRPETKIDTGRKVANVLFHVTLNRHSKFGQVEIAGTTPPEAQELREEIHGWWARLRGSAIRPGKKYRLKTITNATNYLQRALEKQGYLAAKVNLTGAEYDAGTNRADIHFEVHTGPIIHVKIEGAHLWSWTRKSLLPVYQGVGVDRELVQEGRQALASYFQGKGYFDVKVDSKFQRQAKSATIIYQIAKGKKHSVEAVKITGNRNESTDALMAHVAVQKEHFLSRGKYSEALVRSSVKNLVAMYQADGFSSANVTPKVVNEGKNVSVAFHIDEGPRDMVRSVKIEGAETLRQMQYAPGGIKVVAGQPYSQKLVQADRKNILAHYLELGYLTATFRETAKAVSKQEPHRIDVVYHIYEGPRVYTASVITLGRQQTQQRLINQDISSIQPERPLTETKLLTSESQLYNHTGVFDWAEVDPKRRITTQTREDVLVKVHEAKRNQITYGFGFEIINRGGSVPSGTVALPNLPPIGLPGNFRTNEKTFYGPRGTFQYTRNNVRGKAESLSLTGFAGRLDQRGGAFYIDPNFRWSKWASTLALTAEHDGENPIFTSQQELASYQIQRPLDEAKTRILFLRYSFSQTNLTRIEIPALVLPEDRNVRLSTISESFTRDTRDNILDAHKGMLQSLELDTNFSKLGSSVDFAKLTGQIAYYKKIPHNTIWANSIRIGLAQPFAGSRVPLSQEFFTGGGSTLRGFPLDGAGPQRKVQVCPTGTTTDCSFIQVPAGGHELLLINSEFRIPLPIKDNLGMVLFYDGGNVFPNVGFHNFTSLYSNNVGFGLRYATPVGPVRIDLGRNLNPVEGIKATQYFISIGQAF